MKNNISEKNKNTILNISGSSINTAIKSDTESTIKFLDNDRELAGSKANIWNNPELPIEEKREAIADLNKSRDIELEVLNKQRDINLQDKMRGWVGIGVAIGVIVPACRKYAPIIKEKIPVVLKKSIETFKNK